MLSDSALALGSTKSKVAFSAVIQSPYYGVVIRSPLLMLCRASLYDILSRCPTLPYDSWRVESLAVYAGYPKHVQWSHELT